jgi:23S rRNA (pseudouridine1915-N3)-methyltransferase
MQQITLLAVGKTSIDYVKKGEAEWLKRIGKFARLEYRFLKEAHATDDRALQKEGKEILKSVPQGATLVLLDEKGAHYSSRNFAAWLEKERMTGKRICFVIGGAHGFSQEVYQQAAHQLSLSAMTFSHQLIRLFFLEQLYRGLSIIDGHPYHND